MVISAVIGGGSSGVMNPHWSDLRASLLTGSFLLEVVLFMGAAIQIQIIILSRLWLCVEAGQRRERHLGL